MKMLPKLKNGYVLKSSRSKYTLSNVSESIQLRQNEYDILKFCNGTYTVSSIAYYLSQDYMGYADYKVVDKCVKQGYSSGWFE